MAVYSNPLVLDASGLTIKPSNSDDYSIGGNVTISKNLSVLGNIVSRDEERVLVQDAFLDVNFGMVSTSAEPGGLNVVYKAAAAATSIANLEFAARTGTARAAVIDNAATPALPSLTAGDIVQVSNTTNGDNDGLYVVHSSSAGKMEMRAVPTFGDTINFKPAQDDFVTVAADANTVNITHVNCAILQVDANGLYQTAEGSTDGDFSSFASLSGSLQDAYVIGQTIDTGTGSSNPVTIAGSQSLVVSATGGASITFDLSVGGLANLNGGIAVDTSAFTVADISGNVATAGTLDVAGLASLDGGIDVDGAFTVADTSGNVATSGTLQAGESTLSSATVSDLTSGRVVLAGTAGAIEDSPNLLFNGSTLAVTGAVDASGSVAAGTMTIDSGSITDTGGAISFGNENLTTTGTLASGDATITGFVDASGSVSAGTMTIDSGSITDTSGAISFGNENLTTTGSLAAGSAAIADLTSGRVVLAGTSGELEGDANFRFDGTNLDIGAAGSEKFRVAVASGDTTISGGLDVTTSTGSIVLDSSASANTNLRLKAAQGILLESHAVFMDHAGINVKNATASNIAGGTVLYASGWDNTDTVSQVEAADSASDHHPIGIAPHQHGAGQVRPMASVPGTYIDGLTIAGGGASGDAVYLNGTSMSTVAPTSGTVYRLGYLANPSGTAGQASMIWRPQFIAKIN